MRPALRLVSGQSRPSASSRTGAMIRVHAAEQAYDDAQFAWFDACTNAERSMAKAKIATTAHQLEIAEARLWRIEAEILSQPWLELVHGGSDGAL